MKHFILIPLILLILSFTIALINYANIENLLIFYPIALITFFALLAIIKNYKNINFDFNKNI